MEFSRMYKYHSAWYGWYGIEGITVISSVEIENDIVGVWLAIVIVPVQVLVSMLLLYWLFLYVPYLVQWRVKIYFISLVSFEKNWSSPARLTQPDNNTGPHTANSAAVEAYLECGYCCWEVESDELTIFLYCLNWLNLLILLTSNLCMRQPRDVIAHVLPI